MAAEKRSQPAGQSIVDQDAAITAYLDGLLRDPEQDEATNAPRPRKAPGLKVIAPEAAETDGDPASDMQAADGVLAGADDEPTVESQAGIDEAVTEEATAADASDEAAMIEPEPEAAAAPDPTNEPAGEERAEAEAADADAEEMAHEAMAAAAQAERAVTPVEPAAISADVPSPWAWLRVGGMLLALPADEVVSRHADPALSPVPGAPSQVAGALDVDGRPRLILSLATVTGARSNEGAPAEAFLLGKGGLWGVIGERVEQPVALDEEAVQWRSEAQKAERRAWLGGTAASAGAAVLDVAGLRAALKGSR